MAKVKINFALEESVKAWVEEQASLLGISQAGFLSMVVTQYKMQQEAMNTMKDMSFLMDKLGEMQSMIKEGVKHDK